MAQFPANIDVSSLDGTNGFKLSGVAAFDLSGCSVASAGDVNGDGFADLIVGAKEADPHGSKSGASYVVFGKAAGFAANLDLSSLDGSSGFKLSGVAAGDHSGYSVASAGDVNGDGFADLIVGAPIAQANGVNTGASYVVFGKATGFAANLDLSSLDGSNGFRLDGAPGDRSGKSVASAGDVNGDGIADLIVGAVYGATYVVFGRASGFAANIDLSSLDGSNGFRLPGASAYQASGASVASAGDVNGDGFADLIVGLPSLGPEPYSGESLVVFGKAFAANPSSLDGTNGFELDGVAYPDLSGFSVASAGDVNGDGFADVIVGAPGAGANRTGASYVVFGKAAGFAANIDLSSLDGSNGFRLDGGGFSVASAGDVNGDGFADLIVGAHGEGFVMFGKASGFAADLDLSSLDGSNGFRLSGVATYRSGISVASAGDVNGDGFADLIVGVNGAVSHGSITGASYVIFGREPDTAVNRTGTIASQTLAGGAFADILSGLGGNDTLYGHGGNDRLDGGVGSDTMIGGTGNDTYVVDNVGDIATELLNGGYDIVDTTLTTYKLGANVERVNFTGSGNFVGLGNALENRFGGGAGNERFVTSAGADIYGGGGGSDSVDYRTAATGANVDFSTGSFGGAAAGDVFGSIEKIFGSDTAADTMTGGPSGRFKFFGFGGDDTLTGGSSIDQLSGGTGNDTLAGLGGPDSLDGGAGNDTMTGGAGVDLFVYSAAGFGQDRVTDFEDGLDRFKVNSSVADALSDYTITNNGSSNVMLALVADPTQTIALHGSSGSNLTITAADFVFY